MARTFDASALATLITFADRTRNSRRARTQEIEPKDDDAEGVEAMLRWLYTFDYEDHFQQRKIVEGNGETDYAHEEVETKNTLDLHLSVCVVADKYELLDLHNEAVTRFRKELANTNENEVSRIFGQVREEGSTYAQAIIDFVNVVRDIRLGPTSLTICSFDKTPLNTNPTASGCSETSSRYLETEQRSDALRAR
ncbi:hypothetical protein LTR27_002448 [Elasticomyces elasticus]|nr:hypothetical protein LTR27_002448 [Elasticomyces elasticus]